MEALAAIKNRRSIRNFSEQAVSRNSIENIIDCARLAPSANNIQPWEFVIIIKETTRKRIASLAAYGRFIADAPVCIAVFCKNTKYYLEDGCAATENILIAASAMEMASCWVAGDKKEYASEIGDILGVPDSYNLVSLIALGYSNIKVSARDKREIDEVLHWGKFQPR